jgi:Na+-translocating ferredoxin:NAD+ oxidoreductase RnfG subunit
MKYTVYALVLAYVVFAMAGSGAAFSQVARKNEVISLRDGLKIMLQEHGAASLKKLTVSVDAEKAKELKSRGVEAEGSYTVYQGLDGDGILVGSVLIINEEGKEGPLQVLVALNPEGAVYDTGFTVFGEDKGKPAMGWQFLRQFQDKGAGDAIALGDDIDGVSGATWTSTSVVSAVNRAVHLYDAFF